MIMKKARQIYILLAIIFKRQCSVYIFLCSQICANGEIMIFVDSRKIVAYCKSNVCTFGILVITLPL